jgi:hypothetical protein
MNSTCVQKINVNLYSGLCKYYKFVYVGSEQRKFYCLLGRALWNHRNTFIFDGQDIYHLECLRFFKEGFKLIMHRAKPSLKEDTQQFLDNLQ